MVVDKHVLGLELATDPRWVNIAQKNIHDILIDHAYCEQKAASSCISLIVQYPEKAALVEVLAPVVAEEWNHFERVLDQLRKRNLPLGPQRKDEYVEGVSKLLKKGGSRDQQLVERLLMNALIEARSCERFRLLWKEVQDAELSQFYHELMVSEASHYKNFLQLAKEYAPAEEVETRWRELLKQEADVVRALGIRADRMH
ncbi:MAG: tRNA-(ms[2]io[6]A)-hydroxylase [Cyclobacteriaceae bacterium]|jgi:tRNA-(ms[2]io[6]A)-hydroxylase|nr:tRNA-(ms[2]io[6]A)-hydroxylase [Cyclobacteriaceae bacterium]